MLVESEGQVYLELYSLGSMFRWGFIFLGIQLGFLDF